MITDLGVKITHSIMMTQYGIIIWHHIMVSYYGIILWHHILMPFLQRCVQCNHLDHMEASYQFHTKISMSTLFASKLQWEAKLTLKMTPNSGAIIRRHFWLWLSCAIFSSHILNQLSCASIMSHYPVSYLPVIFCWQCFAKEYLLMIS